MIGVQDTVIGRLGIESDGQYITRVLLKPDEALGICMPSCRLLEDAFRQMEDFLAGTRTGFELPLMQKGTPFMWKVWAALDNIPYGSTVSYKEVAEAIGHPKASRAVGMANSHNVIPIIIPCHRVIGHSQKMVGYTEGIEIKKRLIDLEKSNLEFGLQSSL